jgi:hypothetical protein
LAEKIEIQISFNVDQDNLLPTVVADGGNLPPLVVTGDNDKDFEQIASSF